MRKLYVWIIAITLMVFLAACGGQANSGETEGETGANSEITEGEAIADTSVGSEAAPRETPLNVVATTGQIADTTRNIGGDTIELVELLGPGIDPHTYVATEGDISAFQNADVILYNGLHLEAQLERVLEQIGDGGDTIVVPVGESIDELSLLNWEPEAGLPFDPHIWNDVRLWIEVSNAIRDTLVDADPANADLYEANATDYIQQLEELHEYILAEREKIPQEQRVLVTAHDAFGYYARAYGFAVEAVQGISTESEASTADIQTLADIVVENGVPAMFIETTISPRTIEAVQEAVRAQGQEVEVGGTIYSDAMGEPGSGADTYIGMMRHNIDTIVGALGE
ncbi:MAG: manganese transporter [Chloroflexi bacterium AL-W]|nr:manganese transporter [Chloroflexi bacterium AL-N1]NOK69546.1 manganese transporter [Chloroflexi bacterium AL-N10]NOK77511.1 manganese transporter [Chloroflexi bacterium AL-N5]NOK84362.1 manganese transporter [Chloroflexi bacterium AL-W]NOK91472.1 manganese transporter [Chloroflexi bacterium AL-N15]